MNATELTARIGIAIDKGVKIEDVIISIEALEGEAERRKAIDNAMFRLENVLIELAKLKTRPDLVEEKVEEVYDRYY